MFVRELLHQLGESDSFFLYVIISLPVNALADVALNLLEAVLFLVSRAVFYESSLLS